MDSDENVYVFDLKMICGGYVYFSTFTCFSGYKNHKEVRKPSEVSKCRFSDAARQLGHNPFFVNDISSFKHWLRGQGWAIVDKKFARSYMQQWLKAHECIESSTGVYTDVSLVSQGTLARSFKSVKKSAVLERDNYRCVKCQSTENLTMQHVIPFSRGGETTTRNLVTLCEPCNQELADNTDHSLFDTVGIHRSYDRAIINHLWYDVDQARKATQLSDNLMQTRAELW
ncbi:HNH endonuclease [Vibrio nigripulchritudo]|uniref:HNH endonuclease n=1 Tax=Vibrio nigripulchritudo TaxID=28173 RepID=UPI0012D3FCA3|nr:HNH endonuclease [Vibrio nigripulchritudo]